MTTSTPTNWAGNVTFTARQVHSPTSVEELRHLVASAESIRALGTGHSFNLVADTDGDLVRLDGLPPRIDIDRRASTVTVAGGLRYAQVAQRLHQEGFALANMASLPQISVAGAVATGTHGSGNGLRGLASAVAGLRLVGPGGRLTELRRENPRDRLPGAVIGLGALGIVTDVTLDIEPTYDVAQWVYDGLSLDRLSDGFDEVSGAGHSVSVFTDWHADTAQVWLKTRTDQPGAGHPGERWLGARHADGPRHPIPTMPGTWCTVQSGVPGPWHERLPHFRPDFTPSSGAELQSELILPRAAAREAFAALRDLGNRIRPCLQIAEVRTVAADDLWLSPAYRQDSVALHFTWHEETAAILPVLAAVENRLVPLGARPHWGKLTTLAPEDVIARYERAADFERLMALHDPAGVFRNTFVDDLFPRRS
ncbi:FAD-binding protein [Streptomyces sp. SID13666]|uniref:FAD-binding protein n=1 Tax=unclassified Streptomyces TaxID=2593676 RepID=UPI0013BF5C57|nr:MULTISPECIES: FAD-binding protein [unclassified Streptomyces]NEA52894.1 FAD-binding protein [Streptomyces sp. SID13666]NEA69779.1 FAD-binding protein [Streptomyces sp. SID13588]